MRCNMTNSLSLYEINHRLEALRPNANITTTEASSQINIFDFLVPGLVVLIFALLLIITVLCFIHFYIKKQQYSKLKNQCNNILQAYQQDKNPNQVLKSLNILTKSTLRKYFPDESITTLYGEHWIQYLDKKAGSTNFTKGNGRFLGCYYKQQLLSTSQIYSSIKTVYHFLRLITEENPKPVKRQCSR